MSPSTGRRRRCSNRTIECMLMRMPKYSTKLALNYDDEDDDDDQQQRSSSSSSSSLNKVIYLAT
ncbi:hypothetical protein BLOT_004099 [Blomia tropicalis]|nr:hypothetical protein BLOT_004099 [Blomia tropicalis]